jgi:hypothetical protein
VKTQQKRLCDAAKTVLKGKFIAKRVYIKKAEKFQVSNLMIFFKPLEKKNKTNLKAIDRKK